jgi:hypothetical protein
MTESNYMDTIPPEQPTISKRIWRALSSLRPGGRRHYRQKETPFGVTPNPRKYHRAEWRKRRKRIKTMLKNGGKHRW